MDVKQVSLSDHSIFSEHHNQFEHLFNSRLFENKNCSENV